MEEDPEEDIGRVRRETIVPDKSLRRKSVTLDFVMTFVTIAVRTLMVSVLLNTQDPDLFNPRLLFWSELGWWLLGDTSRL